MKIRSRLEEMGKKKLELRKLETLKERSSKFSKRKKGILKKAEELSVLCGVDVALLLFSPTSKPCLLSRPRSLSKILERLHNVPLRERLERREYTIQMLRNMNSRNNNENIPSGNDNSSSEREEMFQDQENIKIEKLREFITVLDQRSSILRDWNNPHMIENFNRLNIMEQHLTASLNQIIRIKRGAYSAL